MKRAAILLCLLLTGCAMQTMEAGSEADIGNGISVMPQPGFAQVHLATIRYWTQNGTGLDEIGFYTGIADGGILFTVPGKRRDELPVFRARMAPNDVEDLAAAALTKKGMQAVHTGNLRPCPFGTAQGFCFDLTLANEEGLQMRGRALARVKDGVLDLLLFTAPSGFYFDQTAPAVERIFSSVRTG